MSSTGAALLLIISVLGMLGSLALLVFAWREWQRERIANSENPTEVLRVYRDQGAGDLWLEMDGQRYRRVTDIRDGAVGRRLLATLGDLQRWVRAATPNPATPAETPSARTVPLSSPAAAPRPSRAGAQARASAPGGEAPQGMIEANDGIIQSRLLASPLAGRQINMQAAPDGSAQIVVDGLIYQGVSEVTDPTVREFLQSAVAEWERSV